MYTRITLATNSSANVPNNIIAHKASGKNDSIMYSH